MSKPPIDRGIVRMRFAITEDVPALSALLSRAFRSTFGSDNTPNDMEQYVERSFSPAQIRSELEDPSCTFMLAFAGSSDNEPIGCAKLKSGSADPAIKGSNPLELERLYVDRGVLGKGVGAALMRACLEEAAARGHRTLWLGVWQHNPSAIEFYQRWGFTRIGTHEFLLGSDRQIDIVMERSL